MLLRDVPKHPAYVVFHDAYDNGAMDVWPAADLVGAQRIATVQQQNLEDIGQDECGFYRAYTKLPRKKVYKFYSD
jgi:hypothetical protein